MADESKKRKAPAEAHPSSGKRSKKGKKQWKTSRHQDKLAAAQARTIESGDSGIWATCNMGREAKAVSELRMCFEEYVTKMYGASHEEAAAAGNASEEETGDIEAEIKKELEGIKKPAKQQLFQHVRVDTDCIMFFRTKAPIQPVELVRRICEDAMASTELKTSRFIKRLTPMTLMGKATEKGLEEVAAQVLAPHFHGADNMGKKFAIRPNIRNHKMMTRDQVIKTVAAAVGPGHKVDLKDYDLLILVDIYKNMCGMSVVGEDFERLKRYNLSEIYEPTPKEQPTKETQEDPKEEQGQTPN